MGLLERLKAGVNNTRSVLFLGETLTLRVLSEAELQQCRSGAEQVRGSLGLDDETVMLETVLRQLYKAVTDSEGKALSETFDSFKAAISRSEREYLVDQYLELEQECSPCPEMLTVPEYEQLKEEVKKSPDMLLSPSSIALLKKLTAYLASQQRN